MVDAVKYFVINRGRQYGKTTTFEGIKKYLSEDYIISSMAFQFLDASDFEDVKSFVKVFPRELYFDKKYCKHFNNELL